VDNKIEIEKIKLDLQDCESFLLWAKYKKSQGRTSERMEKLIRMVQSVERELKLVQLLEYSEEGN
jgi:hypothetical protein